MEVTSRSPSAKPTTASWDPLAAPPAPAPAPPPPVSPARGPGDGVDPFDRQVPLQGKPVTYLRGAGDASDIIPEDIRQGQIGDCFLASALAAIARGEPQAIRDMIHANRDAADRITSYTVTLYRRDADNQLEPLSINVDASRFSRNAAQPGDQAGPVKEIWPLVLEKAFAQLQGGYSRIAHGGSPAAALEALTGQEVHGMTPASYTFADFQAALASGRPVTAGTRTTVGDPSLKARHSYAVVDIKVERGRQMVQLYNPWGTEHPGTKKPYDGWISFDTLQREMAVVAIGGPALSAERPLPLIFREPQGLRG